MTRLALIALVLLAACGADGPPVPPQGQAIPIVATIGGEGR